MRNLVFRNGNIVEEMSKVNHTPIDSDFGCHGIIPQNGLHAGSMNPIDNIFPIFDRSVFRICHLERAVHVVQLEVEGEDPGPIAFWIDGAKFIRIHAHVNPRISANRWGATRSTCCFHRIVCWNVRWIVRLSF